MHFQICKNPDFNELKLKQNQINDINSYCWAYGKRKQNKNLPLYFCPADRTSIRHTILSYIRGSYAYPIILDPSISVMLDKNYFLIQIYDFFKSFWKKLFWTIIKKKNISSIVSRTKFVIATIYYECNLCKYNWIANFEKG